MIKLSRMTDYAVLLMSVMQPMPHSSEMVLSAQVLSLKTGLSVTTISKILKMLSAKGMVQSVRGSHGGYQLQQSARHISVAQIIEAVDGPIAITDCLSDRNKECNVESICQTKKGWQKINEGVRKAFDEVTLEELML